MRRRLLSVLLLPVLAACGGSDAPDYTPVPEAELYEQVEAVPGVERHHLSAHDSLSQGDGYAGPVVVEPGADPVDVLDRVLAILWQGTPGAGYSSVEVVQGLTSTGPGDVGLLVDDDFEARYGLQPGTGEPPTDKPPLAREP